MKSFRQFIKEDEDLRPLIHEKCQPFLEQARGLPLYRGALRDGIVTVRKDRKPTNSLKEVSAAMDDWFSKHFGIRPRSEGLFTSGNQDTAEGFGHAHYCFPIGEFQFVWAEGTKDSTFVQPKFDYEQTGKTFPEKYDAGTGMSDTIAISGAIRVSSKDMPLEEATALEMQKVKWRTDNLHQAIDDGAEIVILCEKVIMISIKDAKYDSILHYQP